MRSRPERLWLSRATAVSAAAASSVGQAAGEAGNGRSGASVEIRLTREFCRARPRSCSKPCVAAPDNRGACPLGRRRRPLLSEFQRVSDGYRVRRGLGPPCRPRALWRAWCSKARPWKAPPPRPRPPAGSPAPRARPRHPGARRRGRRAAGAGGRGQEGRLRRHGAEHAAATAYGAVKASGLTTLRIELPNGGGTNAARAALGVRLASYRFDKYRTKEPEEKKPSVTKTQIVAPNIDAALARLRAARRPGRRHQLHARPGVRAAERALSRRVRPPGEGSGEPGPRDRDPRRT